MRHSYDLTHDNSHTISKIITDIFFKKTSNQIQINYTNRNCKSNFNNSIVKISPKES